MKTKKELTTEKRVEQYHALHALLSTWEKQPNDVQIKNHDYLLGLRARVRNVRNYVIHRKDANATI